jgi:predicted DNA-binding protein
MEDKNTMTIKIRLSPSLYARAKGRSNRWYKGNLSKFVRDAIEEKTKAPIKRASVIIEK